MWHDTSRKNFSNSASESLIFFANCGATKVSNVCQVSNDLRPHNAKSDPYQTDNKPDMASVDEKLTEDSTEATSKDGDDGQQSESPESGGGGGVDNSKGTGENLGESTSVDSVEEKRKERIRRLRELHLRRVNC